MKTKTCILGALMVVGLAGANAIAATAEPLPATLATNITAVQSACAQLRYDQVLLDISRAINDAAGVSTNLTAVKADQTAVQAARQALATVVQNYMQAAQDSLSAADTAYETAFAQLRADRTANPGALTADKANVLSTFTAMEMVRSQLQANQQALAGAGATGGCMGGNGHGNGGGLGSGGNLGGSVGLGGSGGLGGGGGGGMGGGGRGMR